MPRSTGRAQAGQAPPPPESPVVTRRTSSNVVRPSIALASAEARSDCIPAALAWLMTASSEGSRMSTRRISASTVSTS